MATSAFSRTRTISGRPRREAASRDLVTVRPDEHLSEALRLVAVWAGVTLGGPIAITGSVIAIFWSFPVGIIVALIGLGAFGGLPAIAGTSSQHSSQ
jgi:hypothetical protein